MQEETETQSCQLMQDPKQITAHKAKIKVRAFKYTVRTLLMPQCQ
jgi:hypothetical protein